ncbi:23S rRNA (cytidine1920-2'-O)/16S rRNA (cytidine1409-2'-O)-methyltransferase [Agromyces ramosus]|jgi:23S rRNA (cytidine1920-2'-O)/16S rRNA (cytidine1409-2'-O)-methyltransferase|uniref:23S rRNA (Cytidine1920-2'-O)/16S rRNA (Cytidine1409-2'-O)-methyltransferase n=1 Tax=Agromyces ramosus TaxID=33879 RepID=A0A4Q7MJC6_9MICO|nr:TlyA family RNA methyltransferase [Agromyces ramosus]RZS66649.1 23S rRNA (cytidine1920-2'-O)/16S rRNA (cytidine1409-2'-O)-methyltransferase [Agromyces ramosus]
MPDQRLDAALAARGLARSRTHAATLIAAGVVTVDGRPVVKPALKVAESAMLEVAASDHYVSRAAHKLLAALDEFAVDPAGRVVLDAGASTGGFSQVLLERGARTVLAVDVGHGQLAPELHDAPGLVLVEGCNVRNLDRDVLAELTGVAEPPSLVTADLSFISLTTVLPALRATAADDAEFVLLVKPQFEVGRGGVREGVVRSAALRSEAVANVLWAAFDLGLGTAGVLSSPIAGSHGNHEYLVHLSASRGMDPTEWMRRVEQVTGGANA